MNVAYEKIKRYTDIVKSNMYQNVTPVTEIYYAPTQYKTNNEMPKDEDLVPFEEGSRWGSGGDTHAWLKLCFTVPENMKNAPIQLWLEAGANGWDPHNPQMIVYKNGKMIQGTDTNHQYVYLDETEGRIEEAGYLGLMINSTTMNITTK